MPQTFSVVHIFRGLRPLKGRLGEFAGEILIDFGSGVFQDAPSTGASVTTVWQFRVVLGHTR